MALDGEGHEIATDEVYLIAGRVRRIDGDTVLVALGERGEQVIRVAAGDVLRVASTLGGGGTTDHGSLSGLSDDDHPQYAQKSNAAFDTVAPSSAVAGTTSNHLTRVAEVTSLMDGLLGAALVLFAAAMHAHAATEITVDSSAWTEGGGFFAGFEGTTLQDALDYVNDNASPP